MSTEKREFWVGLGMLAVAALGWFVVIPIGIDMPASVEFRALSPDFWPHVVMILVAVSGAVVAIQAYLQMRGVTHDQPVDPLDALDADGDIHSEDVHIEYDFPVRMARVVGVLAGLFVIYFLIPHIGIIAAGMVLILAVTYALGERRFKYTVPLAVLLPTVLYGFFVYVANVPMPLGVFEALR